MNAGRELDTMVAAALLGPPVIRHIPPWDGEIKPGAICAVEGWSTTGEILPYSTDAEYIHEMLAWLNEREWFLDLSQNVTETIDGGWECEGWRRSYCYPWSRTEGDTIQHALALLVVAVASKERP